MDETRQESDKQENLSNDFDNNESETDNSSMQSIDYDNR